MDAAPAAAEGSREAVAAAEVAAGRRLVNAGAMWRAALVRRVASREGERWGVAEWERWSGRAHGVLRAVATVVMR